MEELVNRMKVVLATSFSFYLKAHYYHWNVEGIHFSQYHQFFAELYQEIHESIDQTAEQIRALDAYAPGSLKRYKELSKEKNFNLNTIPFTTEEFLIDYFEKLNISERILEYAKHISRNVIKIKIAKITRI